MMTNITSGALQALIDKIKSALSLKADKTEIPTVPEKLPNPQPITINGSEYDGTSAVNITISGDGSSFDPSELEAEIALKADKSELDLKADKTELATKADASALELKADKSEIPTIPATLPNPYKLTINGTEYDGSAAATVNISGENNVFIMDITSSNDEYTSNKTYNDVLDAVSSNKIIVVNIDEVLYTCVRVSLYDDQIYIMTFDDDDGIMYLVICCNSDDTVEVYSGAISNSEIFSIYVYNNSGVITLDKTYSEIRQAIRDHLVIMLDSVPCQYQLEISNTERIILSCINFDPTNNEISLNVYTVTSEDEVDFEEIDLMSTDDYSVPNWNASQNENGYILNKPPITAGANGGIQFSNGTEVTGAQMAALLALASAEGVEF